MQYKYCVAYVALLILHWIALQQRNALLCSRSVQLQQILDFSLGGERCSAIEITAGIERNWWWSTSWGGAHQIQFPHYYETYLSCFDYKNIYWIVRLSNWILHDVLKESSHSHIARVQNWPEITVGHSLGESLDLGLGQEVPWILKWQSVSEQGFLSTDPPGRVIWGNFSF